MLMKYPFVKQESLKDCGVACLAMIIKYYKGYVGLEMLRDMSKTNRNGTSAYNLISTALELGFEAKGVKTTIDDINSDNLVLPCIAHVVINESYKHYVVIYKIDYKKRIMIIADPSDGIIKIKFDDFDKIWSKVLLILYPIKNIPIYENHSIIKFTFKLLLTHRKILANILILSMLVTIFTITSSFYLQWILKSISTSNPKLYITWVFFVFLSVYLMKIISDFIRNKLLIHINQKIDLALTTDTFKNIMELPYSYYRNRTTGEILSRINDLGTVRNMISRVVLTVFIDLLVTSVALIFLYLINSTLFFIAIIIFLLYLLIVYIFKRTFIRYIDQIQKKRADVSSYIVEAISGFETFKGLDIKELVVQKFKTKYIKLLKDTFQFDNIYNLQLLLKELINEIGFVIIIAVGILMVIDAKMTIGSLLTFNALLIYFLNPIRNLVDLDINIKEAENALRRVMDLNQKEIDNGIIDSKLIGDIKFNNLTYSYDNQTNLLNSISCEIKQGEKVMITGQSGSGKSTIFKILKKYYLINRNMIKINGIDLNDYKLDSLKKGITYISQNEILFTDTVNNNIRLNRSIPNDIFFKINKICQVDNIVNHNSQGYNMLLEENGFNISGGEGQRIILARSLLKNSAIILIDEGFSQMDVNLERLILKEMFIYFKKQTIILISHRLDNIDLFNHLIEIEDGKIKKDVLKYG